MVAVTIWAAPHHGYDDSGRANGSCGSRCGDNWDNGNDGSGVDGGSNDGSCGEGKCNGGNSGNGNSDGSGKATKTMVVEAMAVGGNATIN